MNKSLIIFLLSICLLPIYDAQCQSQQGESITTPSGVNITIIENGNGKLPQTYDKIKVYYKGCLTNGACFDSLLRGKPFVFKLGKAEVIPGWDEAFRYLSKGARAKLYIPAHMGYGKRGVSDMIPPNSDLIFEVEVR